MDQAETMRTNIERRALPESPRSQMANALGLMTVGVGFLLGVGLGLGIAAAVSRPRPVSATDREELASLKADRVLLAARASQLDHDMRTPIGTLATALDWMNTSLDEPGSQAEAREVMGRQVNRMRGLTEELHKLAQQLGS